MVSPISSYTSPILPSSQTTRPILQDAGDKGRAANESTTVTISSQGAALAEAQRKADEMSAAQGGFVKGNDPVPYPQDFPPDLKEKLNQVFSNPNISDTAKGDIYVSMVMSPAYESEFPGSMPGAPNYNSPSFDSKRYIS